MASFGFISGAVVCGPSLKFLPFFMNCYLCVFLLLVSELQVLKFLVHFELILQTETSLLLFHVDTTSQYSLLPRL